MKKKQMVKTLILIQLISIISFCQTTTVIQAQVSSSGYEIIDGVLISDGHQGTYWSTEASTDPAIVVSSNGDIHVVWECGSPGPWGDGGDYPAEDDEILYAKYTASTNQWSNATSISDGYLGSYWNHNDSLDPEMAIDGLGNIHVVWEDETPGPWGLGCIDSDEIPNDREILYANYTAAAGWSNVTCVSDGYNKTYWNHNYSKNPDIAADSLGNIHIVWDDGTPGPWGVGNFDDVPDDSEIMYVNYTVGTGWSNVSVISDGYDKKYWNHNESIDPAIAVDSSGNVHVVWEDGTPGAWGEGYGWQVNNYDTEIMYVNYTATNGWSNATVISDGYLGSYWNHNESEDPHIAVDISGGIHVVWEESTPGMWGGGMEVDDTEVGYVKFTPGSGWSNVSIISDGYLGNYWNTNYSYDPQIIAGENGILHVIWEDATGGYWGDDGEDEVMYIKYTPGSGWSNVTIVSDGYNGIWDNDGDSEDPDFAIDANGVLHVVWEDGTDGAWGTEDEIWYAKLFIRPTGPPPNGMILIITFIVVGGVVIAVIVYRVKYSGRSKVLSKTTKNKE